MTAIKVLDHGYVDFVRIDGDDEFLAQTARTSTQSSGDPQKDANLVTRLVRDRHTSPIEFGGVVMEIAMPIFVARQWMRHRTGAFNEFSMRYTEAMDVFYVPEPERCQAQSTFNKQGSAESLDIMVAQEIRHRIYNQSIGAYSEYKKLLDLGLTRELARAVLPVNYYTKVRWKIDLHNLMHFLLLREDSHAQYEIRVYAEAIHRMLKAHFPIAVTAFENHIQNRVVLSRDAATFLAERMLDNYELEEILSGNPSLLSELKEFGRRN
jgi:thymidylate synthase (FAD)